MDDENSDNSMDVPADSQGNGVISNTIPGGKQQTILEEPKPSEGCTSSTQDVTVNNGKEEKTRPKSGQKTIDEYYKSEKRDDNARPNTNDQSPKRSKLDNETDKRPISKISGQSASDDEDNENTPNQYRSGPVTRSVASLHKLRVAFDDSDDDTNNSRYTSWAQNDIAEYRNNYPNARSDSEINDNYNFYTNKIRSHPDGDLIDNIHKHWFGDYRKLEYHHGYIQWLFPLQEKGLNWSAEALQKHEIESIKKDKKALKRILISYKLMLDFYGFELVDEKTGKIRRLRGDSYKERFRNLNTSSHNYLRITRILKCLGEFDYEYLKFPFLEVILQECIIENTLLNCLRSCKDYWIETLRSRDERRAIRQYARELIEYRNKGMTPPKSHHAIRPPSITTKHENISSSKANDDDDNDPN